MFHTSSSNHRLPPFLLPDDLARSHSHKTTHEDDEHHNELASNNEPLHVVAAVRELAALEGDRVGGGVLGLVSGLRKEEKRKEE